MRKRLKPKILIRREIPPREGRARSTRCSQCRCSERLGGTWLDWAPLGHSPDWRGWRGSCLGWTGCPPCPRRVSSPGCTPSPHTSPPWSGSAGSGWWSRGPRWSPAGWRSPPPRRFPRPSRLYSSSHRYTLSKYNRHISYSDLKVSKVLSKVLER